MTAILEVRSLHKHFGGAKVLQDVDLAIDTGEIHCLIGPNGAGKSTLFKVMVGTYEPSAGMSPEETFRTGELIQRLNRDGMTIVVVEHDMTFIRQIAQRVTVLHLGRVFAQDVIAAIVDDPRVAEIYLGKGHVD